MSVTGAPSKRKVLVTLSRPLFAPDPSVRFADELALRLNAVEGVESEVMALPFRPSEEERLLDDAALCGLLRTLNVDRMVALNFPAYLLPFADKVVWLDAHPFAGETDPTAEGRPLQIRRMIRAADIEALSRSPRLFCATERLRQAMAQWCGVDAALLARPEGDERRWSRAIAALLA